jgi:hypothetical protein
MVTNTIIDIKIRYEKSTNEIFRIVEVNANNLSRISLLNCTSSTPGLFFINSAICGRYSGFLAFNSREAGNAYVNCVEYKEVSELTKIFDSVLK